MSEKNETDLDKYKREGKSLTPPLAQLKTTPVSWINDRLPEILWAVLAISQMEREKALDFFRYSLLPVKGDKEFWDVGLSGLNKLSSEKRQTFIDHMVSYKNAEISVILRPLLLFKNLPNFQEWRKAIGQDANPKEDWEKTADALRKCLWHQSQEATDCRWVKVTALILSEKLQMPEHMKQEILLYPNEGDQRYVRPMIRATEIVPDMEEGEKPEWPVNFWKESYELTACIPEQAVNKKVEEKSEELHKEIENSRKHYFDATVKIRNDLIDHFLKTSSTSGIDSRHEAVFGLALFGLGIFIENNFYRTALSVNGRVMLRSLFETYITLAYLHKKENEDSRVWEDYRSYGNGQANLIYRKFEEKPLVSSTIDKERISAIANEDKWVEFVPINLGHWDSSDLRKMCEYVEEKELYDKYYSYTSGFVHGNWNAVRESVFQKCVNPLHRLHRIPTFDLPLMPSATKDMLELINMILELVSKSYPTFGSRVILTPIEANQK